ncbi:hypothetical protein ABE112_27775 [Priestia aryabhattai]|uniref:hypothetical protein n=1 Tax=Priestia TaxID=2800373 RepID=UPI001E42E785|nr:MULTISPECIES: hypothetical protein [Priestia]MCE4093206.1 hypothetical protein [Priestia megaterium]MED3821058.1 hypothetical protein [Priestia aryabhattai]
MKEIFDRLFNEGYDLGKVDGYNDKKYESLSEDSLVNQSSQESQWLMLGYTVGYEKGKRQKQEETIAQQEQERNTGEQEGYKKGLEDYKQATISSNPLQTPAKSTEWNKGFALGYKKAVEIMDLAVKAKKDGYIQGLEMNGINVPELYNADEVTRKAYEEGFQTGQQKRTEELKTQYEKEGFDQGYALQDMSIPQGLAPEIVEAFQKGFVKGADQKEQNIRKQGFNFAFTSLKYKTPSDDQIDTRTIQWFKEGYQSNKVASPLRAVAYRAGWNIGGKMNVPTKYKDNEAAVAMYKEYYELGQQKQKKTAFEVSTVLLVIVSAVGIYTLFRRNKDVSEESNVEIYEIEKTAK